MLGAAIECREEEDRSLAVVAGLSERAEAAERCFGFLAGANALLSASSTDYVTTLHAVACLAVPAIADWCFVDLAEPGGNPRRPVVGHVGSGSSAEIAEEFKRRYPMDPNLPHGTPRVLRTGRTEILKSVDAAVLRSLVTDAEHLVLLRRLAPRSYMCVPLRTRRVELGAVGFVVSGGAGGATVRTTSPSPKAWPTARRSPSTTPPVAFRSWRWRERSSASRRDAAVVSSPVVADTNLTRRQLEVLAGDVRADTLSPTGTRRSKGGPNLRGSTPVS